MEQEFISVVFLPVALASLMFSMGLSLSIEDFKGVVIKPRSLVIGLFCQVILLPVMAYLLAISSGLSPEMKVGLIIIAVCPGGATSNLITYLLRGNVALSVSITTLNSLITLFSIPALIYVALFIFMGMGQAIDLPVGLTILKVFYITLIPVALGVFVRIKWRIWAMNMERYLRVILPVLYGIIYLVAIAGSKQEHPKELYRLYVDVVPYVLILNVTAMLIGYLLSRLLRLRVADQISLTVEIGIQNSALAITIAGSALFLNNYIMAIPSVVYGLITFATALIFGVVVKKFSKE